MEPGTRYPQLARSLARTARLLRVVVLGASALASACASSSRRGAAGDGAAGDPARPASSDGGKEGATGVRGW